MLHLTQRVATILALSATALAAQAASLQTAAQALGVAQVQSLEFNGTGQWFQFGQAPAPTLPWPQFDVSRYSAAIHFESGSERVQINRIQPVEPGRVRPAATEQKVDQYVSGNLAWNVGVAPAPANATPQPASLEERRAEIWSTPHGFLKAALANNASSRALGDGVEVSFTVGGKYRYTGFINGKDQVERVRTWIDNPVLGDTEFETAYSQYKNFGGVNFPSRIVRNLGGHRVLDITVADVKANSATALSAPDNVAQSPAGAPITVAVSKLADGVFYLTGGTHHSLAIDQKDHIVIIEGPQHEARSQAVIDKAKEVIPGKPIKYLINSHAHFDHSGGVRTFVDEGATIVTHAANVPYYQKAWAAPHTLNPDRLARSGKAARFESFETKHVLSDGKRSIEIHQIAGNSHNDAFALIYLPAEKILIEADAYTPLAPNAPAPTSVNPYAANLLDNVEKLKLNVEQIAALHGPGVVKLDALRAFVSPAKVASN